MSHRADSVRLGKHDPKIDSRTLQFSDYLPTTPKAPAKANWIAKGASDWGMMLNDKLGDCTCAAKGHAEQLWTANASSEVTVADADVLAAYERLGYNPADPNTDQGASCLDSLNDWRSNGIGGHKVAAFAQIDPTNLAQVKFAIANFGLVYIGVALPISAQQQPVWKSVGGKAGAPGSWGGHCIILGSYSPTYLQCITWGEGLSMTNGFFKKYCDEAYAVISDEWITAQGSAPSGLNLTQLQSDLAAITSH